MDISLLRLKYIINRPDYIATDDYIFLEDLEEAPILVFSAELAKQIFKSPNVAPLNLLNFWKSLCSLEESSLPTITQYFAQTPLLLDGPNHIEKRKQLLKVYAKIDPDIKHWLGDFTLDFIKRNTQDELINVTELVTFYVRSLGKRIIQEYLQDAEFDPPKLPLEILHFVPTLSSLENYNQPMQEYILKLQQTLKKNGNDESDAYPLMSVIVMGTEPLIGALCYAIKHFNEHKDWDIPNILSLAAPVRVIGRYVKNDFQIGALSLKREQRIYLDIHQINLRQSKISEQDSYGMSFGYATHLCPGRAMSIKIMEAFKHAWLSHASNKRITSFGFSRDLLLRPNL